MSTVTGGSRFSYPFITIGTQIWTSKNLDVSTYRNGDPIPQVTDFIQWQYLTTGAWCYYNNDDANGPIYGKLYNWYAVNDQRGLAPSGWHVSSNAEWSTLFSYLGNISTSGGKLKETGTSHWNSPNTGATNSTGFTGLPGGYRDDAGSFSTPNTTTIWWTSTQGYGRQLNYNSAGSVIFGASLVSGFSVRLIKD